MCFSSPTYAERNWPAEPPEPTPFELLWLCWFLHSQGFDHRLDA